MADRLSAWDASFLYLEQPTTPMHVGAVAVLERPGTRFDFRRLVRLVEQRIALVPRYRQKVRELPGGLTRPVWVDDAQFDITHHVRRSALPSPGSDAELYGLVARLVARPLDRDHPLWEVYLVEGLAGGRIALVTKTHQAMVDGLSAAGLGTVLMDVTPTPREAPATAWVPEPEPSTAELACQAVAEAVRRPGEIVDDLRQAALGGRGGATARQAASALLGVASTALGAVRPRPGGPLNQPVSTRRRFAVARTRRADYRTVRTTHGGDVTDVALAVLAGALRSWLMSRGVGLATSSSLRALVPVTDTGEDGGQARSHRRSAVVNLPVGERDPVVRLSQVSHAMRAQRDGGVSRGADLLVRLGGSGPATLHSLGARLAGGLAQRVFNLAVTAVSGPRFPLYLAGIRMTEAFPVVPLLPNQALAVGLTCYEEGVYYGFNADRDAMSDLDTLAALVEESLEELVATVP